MSICVTAIPSKRNWPNVRVAQIIGNMLDCILFSNYLKRTVFIY
jgi:hypothetical protein